MNRLPTLLLASSAILFVVAMVLLLRDLQVPALVVLAVAIGDVVVALVLRARFRL